MVRKRQFLLLIDRFGPDEQMYHENLQQLARFFLLTYGSRTAGYVTAACETGDALLAVNIGADSSRSISS